MKAALAAAVVALGSCVGLAAAAGGPAEQGQTLFQAKCTSCHTLGGGDAVGPDLKGIVDTVDPETVRRFIAEPDKLIAEGDPAVKALVAKYHGIQMPNLGLTAADVGALVAYLETQGTAATTTTTATTTTATETTAAQGDAAAGKDLFTGGKASRTAARRASRATRSPARARSAAARLGPTLTGAYEKYGGAKGFAAVLTTIPFKTMVPVYEDHAITKQEAASLAAYLATTSGDEPSSSRTWLLVVLGVAVTAGLLALALLIWPRRRLDVRRRLLADTRRP